MYSYQAIMKNGSHMVSPMMKTIGHLKRHFRRIEGISSPRLYNKDSSKYTEIVVLKHSAQSQPKIYGYYDVTFVKDPSKPVFINNILYGLE